MIHRTLSSMAVAAAIAATITSPSFAAINLGGSVADTGNLDMAPDDPFTPDDCDNPLADVNALTPPELVDALEESNCVPSSWFDDIASAIIDGSAFLEYVATHSFQSFECGILSTTVLAMCGMEAGMSTVDWRMQIAVAASQGIDVFGDVPWSACVESLKSWQKSCAN